MQIKSWQIALVGLIPNVLILLYTFLDFYRANFSLTQKMFNVFLIISIIGIIIIPAILLKSRYLTLQKIGAIISILFGLVFLFGSGTISFFGDMFFPLGILILFFPGICFLFAGIHYFWKKV